ncbi:MAG: acylphosphatase [Bacteroidetes bacterium]|nr:acylphosphatase [Bacteroidota bacterium]
MKKHINIIISGQLKGKRFRSWAIQKAYAFNIKGFIRYQENDLFAEAEGEEEDLKKFVEWCRRGPYGVQVQTVNVEEGEMKNFTAFDKIEKETEK